MRSRGWSSPSVYPNADTFTATAAEGIAYTLDGMDSDILSRLATKPGPLVMIPYPTITVDMGQYLGRAKEPADMERLWIDYVDELASEAEADPSRQATVVAIGIHPFVMGTPTGAAALRRVLAHFKQQKLLWATDVEGGERRPASLTLSCFLIRLHGPSPQRPPRPDSPPSFRRKRNAAGKPRSLFRHSRESARGYTYLAASSRWPWL